MTNTVQTDIVIIGGGIAGLWLFNRIRQQGYSAILLESDALGGGQTSKSQGIIHGGMKYALQGKLTLATNAIADMPTVWKKCLDGKGDIDLSHVSILSTKQYLWSTGTLQSKLAGFFAGMALKSKLKPLKKKDYPAIFQHESFHGQVNALDEMVLDVPSLLAELAKPYQDCIFKVDDIDYIIDENDQISSLQLKHNDLTPVTVTAQKYIFTAGVGNQIILNQLQQKTARMQQRPLHMVIVKHDHNLPVYAHCIGLSSSPRLTITTHRARDGKTVWYLGGQLSEEGVKRNSQEQINIAKQELADLFPWLDFSTATFASFFIDRAESLQPDGSRPTTCSLHDINNMIIAWPTKLAFAPLLSEQMIASLQPLTPGKSSLEPLHSWPAPNIATPIWDQLL